jgi:sugar transferase EpsL
VSGHRLYRTVKRAVDAVVAAAGLLVLLPLLILVAILVRVAIGSPVFFRQRRPGLCGKPFRIVKFRTMRHGPGTDAERLTGLGLLLRRLSIDELPGLWNVLRGEMSLVGPRPLMMEYLDRYTPEQARRHDAKPGVTGWAQVNGRNAISWEQRFALDVWYVDHRSLLLDLQILLRTPLRVLRREGISHAGEATMSEFKGTPSGGTGQTHEIRYNDRHD